MQLLAVSGFHSLGWAFNTPPLLFFMSMLLLLLLLMLLLLLLLSLSLSLSVSVWLILLVFQIFGFNSMELGLKIKPNCFTEWTKTRTSIESCRFSAFSHAIILVFFPLRDFDFTIWLCRPLFRCCLMPCLLQRRLFKVYMLELRVSFPFLLGRKNLIYMSWKIFCFFNIFFVDIFIFDFALVWSK